MVGFQPAMAQKLDTTFVVDVDMKIDTSVCYYELINYAHSNGIREFADGENMDFFRVNTGYVTNEMGDTTDVLIYACDRVTKQWRRIVSFGPYALAFILIA